MVLYHFTYPFKVTDAVHAKQGFIFAQIWALGRTAYAAVLEKEGPYEVVGPSAIPLDEDHATPRPLTKEQIKEYVQFYAQAAKNAVRAGFDGTYHFFAPFKALISL